MLTGFFIKQMKPDTRGNNRIRRYRRNGGRKNYASPSISQPLYKPVVTFKRTVQEGFNIVCDGINPSIGVFNFSLNDLPNSTEFSSLFQVYKLKKVSLNWRPEYTELTDAALVSNAVNVNFNSAFDQNGNTPTSVNDILQFENCKSTGITKEHRRSFEPCLFMDGTSPSHCFVSTNSTSTNFFGLSFGIPPTGIAMTFRCTAVYTIICAGAR